MPIITLTTDFGTSDHYVAAMKGVILSIAPSAAIVDVTHEISPQDVRQGAVVLRNIWPYYPTGTIHVVVVDPGVGSDRRIILAQYAGSFVLAPDNGVITLVHREQQLERLFAVKNDQYFLKNVSATFHGRDIFAPVAAHLANGVKPANVGPPTDQVEVLQLEPTSLLAPSGIRGQVLYVDRFGNLISNIRAEDVDRAYREKPALQIYVQEKCVGFLKRTFSEAQPGTPLAYIASSGYLAVGVNHGSAREQMGAEVGAIIELR